MVTVRLAADQVEALDALAESDHGGSRSAALRALIDDAEHGDAPERMTRDDVIATLERHARAGSVPAARLLLDNANAEDELERLRALAVGGPDDDD